MTAVLLVACLVALILTVTAFHTKAYKGTDVAIKHFSLLFFDLID